MCTNYIDISKVEWYISALIWPKMVQFVRKKMMRVNEKKREIRIMPPESKVNPGKL